MSVYISVVCVLIYSCAGTNLDATATFVILLYKVLSFYFRLEKEYTALKSKENEDQIELRVSNSVDNL